MIWKLLFLLSFVLQDVETRSINIVVDHFQTFEVDDDEQPQFIKLPDWFEEHLKLDPHSDSDGPAEQNTTNAASKVDENAIADANDGYDGAINNHGIHDIPSNNNANAAISKANDDVSEYERELDALGVFNNINNDDEDYTTKDKFLTDDGLTNDENDFEFVEEKSNPTSDKILNKFDDILKDDYRVNDVFMSGEHRRKKRSAQEQWRKSLPGAKQTIKDDTEPDVWEEITDDELGKGTKTRYVEILEYLGITLLSAAGFIFIGFCFLRDPIACIFAFGTGCPCCIIFCPCVRSFTDKYMDPKRLVRDSMNKYMPGVIVKEDGTMDSYEPTSEEIEILHELLSEITGVDMM